MKKELKKNKMNRKMRKMDHFSNNKSLIFIPKEIQMLS
jgi:hypothetical protein